MGIDLKKGFTGGRGGHAPKVWGMTRPDWLLRQAANQSLTLKETHA